MLLAIFLLLCLFYKIISSCITKCVTELPIKIRMIRQLEMINQIYSSVSSMIVAT